MAIEASGEMTYENRLPMHMIARTSIRILLLVALVIVGHGLIASANKSHSQGANKTESKSSNVPSFRNDVMPELVRNCATAMGCHGNNATESVNLDLRMTTAYSQLVDIPSKVQKGSMRVKRGEPGASFLVNKIEGTLKPGEGKRMPLDDQTGMPMIPSPISADYLEKVLKPWILAGAPDN
jgi:hypothetical protein